MLLVEPHGALIVFPRYGSVRYELADDVRHNLHGYGELDDGFSVHDYCFDPVWMAKSRYIGSSTISVWLFRSDPHDPVGPYFLEYSRDDSMLDRELGDVRERVLYTIAHRTRILQEHDYPLAPEGAPPPGITPAADRIMMLRLHNLMRLRERPFHFQRLQRMLDG